MLRQIILSSFLLATTSAQTAASNWPGWNRISNVFVFGDSYTTTGFEVNGTQPNPGNPFGNPDFPGLTFSNGRNWIDFLVYTYNDSLISAYNFAKGGASVDSFGQPNPFRPMDQQVQRFFLPNYSQNNTRLASWSSDNSLFAAFFGINDVNLSSSLPNNTATTDLHDVIFRTYSRLVEQLYQAGARNFLFLNVPAIDRAPFTINTSNGSEAFIEKKRDAVMDFNTRIESMAINFTRQHSDAAAFLFDNFGLYNQVLDDPESREDTAVYSNTTGFCFAYSVRTYDEESFNETCRLPQKEFFWLDALHPTPPIHDAMAAEIAQKLRDGAFVGSNATNSTARPNANGASPATWVSGTCRSSIAALLVFFLFL